MPTSNQQETHMGVSATCTGATKNADGSLTINFNDSSQKTYATIADALTDCYTLDSEADLARKWLVAHWLQYDPTASNPATYVNGKTCTVNVGAGNPVAVA